MVAAAKISKKGVYSISMETYHGDCCVGPSISSSGLRTIFKESPAHYFDGSPFNPDRAEQKRAEHFVLGQAAHHLLLGEDDFSTLFIVRPDKAPDGRDWNGNNGSCKQWIADQAKAGRTVLTSNQIDQIKGMARSLSIHPLVRAGILNGDIEKSLIWKDKATGVWLKARPDAIPTDGGDVSDLKTTSFVGFDLDREVSNHRYDMQAALTKWGLKEVLGVEMTSFNLVYVEKDRPHCVDVIALSPDDIADAEKDLRAAVDTFAWCVEHKNWFGPAGTQNDARWVHVSDWAKKSAEFRRDFLKREIDKAATVDRMAGDYLTAG